MYSSRNPNAVHGTVDTCTKCGGTGFFRTRSGRLTNGKCFACNGTGRAKDINESGKPKTNSFVVVYGELLAILERAKLNGARPVMRVDGFIFSLSQTQSNTVYVRYRFGWNEAEGESVPVETYVGKIKDDLFFASIDMNDSTAVAMFAELQRLVRPGTDWTASVVRYGRLTGNCGCCGLGLTNHESIERGIGPICADKWGL